MNEQAFERFVEEARGGDRVAQSAVLEQLEPILRGYFVRRVGANDQVDDLVQNTLLRVLRGFADLKDPKSMRSFALKAALFELQDLFRGRYGSRELPLDPDGPDHPTSEAPEGLSIDLDRALSALSPKARTILEMKAMGYRYEEIASMIESTEAAVKMQVKRALERMREFLGLTLWLISVTAPRITWMLLFVIERRL